MSMPEVETLYLIDKFNEEFSYPNPRQVEELQEYTRTLQQERDVLKKRLEKAEELLSSIVEANRHRISAYFVRAYDFLKGGE